MSLIIFIIKPLHQIHYLSGEMKKLSSIGIDKYVKIKRLSIEIHLKMHSNEYYKWKEAVWSRASEEKYSFGGI